MIVHRVVSHKNPRRSSLSDLVRRTTHSYYLNETIHMMSDILYKQFSTNNIHFVETHLDNLNNGDIVEIDIYDVNAFSLSEIKKLFANHIVFVHDLIDGGLGVRNNSTGYIINPLIVYLMKNRIGYKKIYHVSGSYDFSLNTESFTDVVIPFWLPLGMVTTKLNNVKEQNTVNSRVLFPNMKSRRHRVYLVSLLHENGTLDKIDWSLAQRIKANSLGEFAGNNVVQQFINSVPLPRAIFPVTGNLYEHACPVPYDIVGKYGWHLNVETLYGEKAGFPKQGQYGHVTEKTVKAFLCGAMPLTVAVTGYEDFLRGFGFKIYDTGTEKIRDPNKKIEAMAEVVKYIVDNDIKPRLEDIQHNQKLIQDLNYTCRLITDPVIRALQCQN